MFEYIYEIGMFVCIYEIGMFVYIHEIGMFVCLHCFFYVPGGAVHFQCI